MSSVKGHHLTTVQLVESEKAFLSLPSNQDRDVFDCGPTFDDFEERMKKLKV